MRLVSAYLNQSDESEKNSILPSKKKIKLANLIVDLFLISIIILVGYLHIYSLINSQLFSTGYSDWLIQAFRVRFISEYGLSSWTHIWSNGISLWRGYQFLPHLLTAQFANLFQIEITRAMVILTLIQFVALRLGIYFLARWQKFSPIAGLIAVLLSYDLGQYWGGVNDYSILFGFTLFPLYIALWIQYVSGKWQWVFPYVLGLGFYIHPLLGVYSTGLWITGLLFKSLSRPSIKRLFLQFFILVISSSLFWTQHLSGYVKNYSSPFFTSLTFFKQTLANFTAMGLSVAVISGLAILWLALPVVSATRNWIKAIALYSTICLVAVYFSISVQLPEFIAQTQFSRGMTFVGLAIIVGLIPVIEKIKNSKSLTAKYFLVISSALIIVEAIFISGSFSPHPGLPVEDPVSILQEKYPNMKISNNRIWTPYLDSANYKASLNEKYPNSYMTHSDSNQVSVRLSNLLLYNSFQDKVPVSAWNRVKQYLQITATPYIIFEKNSPFVRSIPENDNQIIDLGEIELKRNIYHAYKITSISDSAVLIDPSDNNKIIEFPQDLSPADPLDQTTLDEYVSDWVTTIYDSKNQTSPIQYTSQDTLDIAIPANHSSSVVYIPESYSKNWQGWFNGEKVKTSPAGPNFIRVDLPKSKSYGLLTLKHDWPKIWYISFASIIFLPVIYLITSIINIALRIK